MTICPSCFSKKVSAYIKTCTIEKVSEDGKTRYKVYNKEKTRSFGTYDTLEEAEKRLKQMHWFGRVKG